MKGFSAAEKRLEEQTEGGHHLHNQRYSPDESQSLRFRFKLENLSFFLLFKDVLHSIW